MKLTLNFLKKPTLVKIETKEDVLNYYSDNYKKVRKNNLVLSYLRCQYNKLSNQTKTFGDFKVNNDLVYDCYKARRKQNIEPIGYSYILDKELGKNGYLKSSLENTVFNSPTKNYTLNGIYLHYYDGTYYFHVILLDKSNSSRCVWVKLKGNMKINGNDLTFNGKPLDKNMIIKSLL